MRFRGNFQHHLGVTEPVFQHLHGKVYGSELNLYAISFPSLGSIPVQLKYGTTSGTRALLCGPCRSVKQSLSCQYLLQCVGWESQLWERSPDELTAAMESMVGFR